MLINKYSDHVAYTFEGNDSVYMLGMRYIRKPHENMLLMTETKYNDSIRLMYGIDGFVMLGEVIEKVSRANLVSAFNGFISSIKEVSKNDFLSINAIDIDYTRLFYDIKNNVIKYAMLPINYELDCCDNLNWKNRFKNTVLIILGVILQTRSQYYNNAYYSIMNVGFNELDVIDYLLKYDYSHVLSETTSADEKTSQDTPQMVRGLVLEHNGELGNIKININKKMFVLGSGDDANGNLSIDNTISRMHCCIYEDDGVYSVEDLGSTNGTRINGFILDPGIRYLINNGDVLMLAKTSFNVIIS